MLRYYLPKHVFLTVVDTSVIFLDLQNDKYICLDPEKSIDLISLLSISKRNLPASVISVFKRDVVKHDGKFAEVNDGIKKLAEDLICHNLLTDDPINAVEYPLLSIKVPELDLSGYEFDNRPNIQIGHVVNFFIACSLAFYKVRFYTTEKMVGSVKYRKRRRQNPLISDLDNIRDLVEIFKILRPLFYTSKDHCLFDSLALIEFMARYGIYPTWIFGVKMGPFRAHCWVQDNNFIYNETLDQAHYFTPIMAI